MNDSFYDRVFEVVSRIPRGRVTTYGAIADYLGTRSSARLVGWSLRGMGDAVPAHRVVNRVGCLTGAAQFGPGGVMQKLLEAEGVEVKSAKVVKFEEKFWEPRP